MIRLALWVAVASVIVAPPALAQSGSMAIQARALAARARLENSAIGAKADAAITAAQSAASKADAASSAANSAQAAVAALDGAVIKQINGIMPAGGVVTLPILTAPDLSGYARTSDVNVAIANAISGLSSASAVNTAIAGAIAPLATLNSLNGVAASIPPVCTDKPASDTTAGAAGTAAACTPRRDAARATQVMPATAITLSDGTFSGSWPGAFPTNPTTAFASAKTATDPYTCQVAVITTTIFSGKCWKIVTMTLPVVASSLLGLVLSPYVNSPAGITVMVVGRQ